VVVKAVVMSDTVAEQERPTLEKGTDFAEIKTRRRPGAFLDHPQEARHRRLPSRVAVLAGEDTPELGKEIFWELDDVSILLGRAREEAEGLAAVLGASIGVR
jgi:hypothetical protein